MHINVYVHVCMCFYMHVFICLCFTGFAWFAGTVRVYPRLDWILQELRGSMHVLYCTFVDFRSISNAAFSVSASMGL